MASVTWNEPTGAAVGSLVRLTSRTLTVGSEFLQLSSISRVTTLYLRSTSLTRGEWVAAIILAFLWFTVYTSSRAFGQADPGTLLVAIAGTGALAWRYVTRNKKGYAVVIEAAGGVRTTLLSQRREDTVDLASDIRHYMDSTEELPPRVTHQYYEVVTGNKSVNQGIMFGDVVGGDKRVP